MIIGLLTASGCKDIKIHDLELNGVLLNYSGCKEDSSSTFKNNNQQDPQECIVFDYNGSVLKLKHVNAYLNCCPGEITADFRFVNQSITITEKEEKIGCLCNCYYDIDYVIGNISAKVYIISIKKGDEIAFECSIDLASCSHGTICGE